MSEPEYLGKLGPGGVFIMPGPKVLPPAGTPALAGGPQNPGYYGNLGMLVPRPSPVPNPAGTIEQWVDALSAEEETRQKLIEAQIAGRDVSHIPLPRAQEGTSQGLLGTLLDYASRPSSAWFGMMKAGLAGEGLEAIGAAGAAGWSGKKKVGFSDVLESAGVPELGRITLISPFSAEEKAQMIRMGVDPTEAELAITGRGVIGFAGEIFLDPFQYWTLGTGKGISLGAKIVPWTNMPQRLSLPAVTLSDAGKAMLSRELQRFGQMGMQPQIARELAEMSVQTHVAQGMGELIKVPALRFMDKAIPGSDVAFALGKRGMESTWNYLTKGASAEWKEFGTKLVSIFNRDYSIRKYLPYLDDKLQFLNLTAGKRHERIQEIAALFKEVSKQDAERITYALQHETSGAVTALLASDPRLGRIAMEVRNRFTDMRAIEIQLGLGHTIRDNYVNQVWQNPPASPKPGLISNQVDPRLAQNKPRVFDVFEEGIEAGLVPVTQDIRELYAIRAMSHDRAVLAHELLTKTSRKYGFSAEEKWAHQKALGKISRGLPLQKADEEIIKRAKDVGVGTQIIWDDLKPLSAIKGLEGSERFVPRAIVEDLQRAVGMNQIDLGAVQPLLRAHDFAQNLFKGYVTSFFPAFHFRNQISNVANSFLDIGLQALNPIRHWQARNALVGKTFDVVTELGETISSKSLYEAARQRGILGTFQHKGEFMLSLKQELGIGNKFDNIIGQNSYQIKAGRAVGDYIEDEARMMLFMTHVRRGYSYDEAAKRVNKFLFDYSNLSPEERGIMRRLMPFYTFMRKNLPLQIEQSIKQPGVPMLYAKVFGQEGRVDPEEIKYLPEWAASGLAVRLGTIDKQPVYFSGLGLPIEDLNRLVAPGGPEGKRGKATISNWLFSMTPFIREVLGFVTNYDFVRNEERNPTSPTYRAFGQLIEKHASRGVKDFLKFKVNHDAKGVPTYEMSSTGIQALRMFVLSRLYTTGGRLLDAAQTPGQSMAAILTGLRLEPVNTETKRVAMETKRAFERRDLARKEATQGERNMMYRGRYNK